MTTERYRLAVLGPNRAGKTALLRRYLNGTFSERYRETVEDIYSRDFVVQGTTLPLDMYDTNPSYPDMTKLTVSNAHAFLLVFAVDDVASFRDVADLYRSICERRENHANIPIVIAGNKADVDDKKIYAETANAWIHGMGNTGRLKYLETSAKTGLNVSEIFKQLLDQSGFPYNMPNNASVNPLLTPMLPRRNHSVRAKSPSRRDASGERSPRSTSPRRPGADSVVGRLTRHGSLMRRTQRMSLRVKHAPPDAEEDDCKIS